MIVVCPAPISCYRWFLRVCRCAVPVRWSPAPAPTPSPVMLGVIRLCRQLHQAGHRRQRPQPVTQRARTMLSPGPTNVNLANLPLPQQIPPQTFRHLRLQHESSSSPGCRRCGRWWKVIRMTKRNGCSSRCRCGRRITMPLRRRGCRARS